MPETYGTSFLYSLSQGPALQHSSVSAAPPPIYLCSSIYYEMQRLLTRGHCVCLPGSTPLLPSPAAWNWVTKLHEHVVPSSMFGRNWHHQPCRCGFSGSSLAHAAAEYSMVLFPFWAVCISWGDGMLGCFCWRAQRFSVAVMRHQRHRQTLHLLPVMAAGPGCSFCCSSLCCKQLYRAER